MNKASAKAELPIVADFRRAAHLAVNSKSSAVRIRNRAYAVACWKVMTVEAQKAAAAVALEIGFEFY